MRTKSISGHSYFVTFLDDYTGVGFAYFLKHKNEAAAKFLEFKAWAETQTGHKIKTMRSDRGTEYTSEAFQSILRTHGIEHQMTTPDSPQSNGRAERWNRTIVEKAMAMLHQAGLSQGFWQLAVACAVHVYNRQPMKRLQWRTPMELWRGSPPDVSYFRVFGCKAYVHVQKDKRHKLEPKALEMTFVGYPTGTKGYLFWNRANRSIVTARDVTFDENVFPARTQPTPSGDEPAFNDSDVDALDTPSDEAEGVDAHDAPPAIPLPEPPTFVPVPVPAQVPDDPPPAPPIDPEEPALPPPPVVEPRPPSHARRRHPSVGVEEPPPHAPAPPPRRSQREGAGRNRRWEQDNAEAEGRERPSQVSALPDSDEVDLSMLDLVLNASEYKSGVPRNRKEAMKSPQAAGWLDAERAEYNSLMENKTWILVPRPRDKPIVTGRWVYDIKSDGRLKARFVARGFTQVWGENYNETFSPVARFESVRYLVAHAALEDWEMEAMDVKTAFLNGDLEEEIFMEQPEGWVVSGKEDYVCLLKKAIYGLKQASRQWNVKIHASLLDLGFVRTYSDAGIYVYRQQRGISVTIVILYVDDILLLGDNKGHIKTVKRTLGRQYKMTDLGAVSRFLGLNIKRDRASRRITIDQEDYIRAVLERFEMAGCQPAPTPLPSNALLVSNPETCSDKDRTKYQSLVGSLMFAALGTRPDISFAVTRLSRYSANPSSEHWRLGQYVLRYLQGTASAVILYDGASNAGLVAYSDSDWAEDKDDRHSTSGQIFCLAGGAVSWTSRRQSTISLSSTEAEYKAASDTCRQMAWLRSFSNELGYDMSHPTPLYVDNTGAIFLSVNPVVERRTKHVDVWYHFIREFYESGAVAIYHVETENMLADALTKNVPLSIVVKFRQGAGLILDLARSAD